MKPFLRFLSNEAMSVLEPSQPIVLDAAGKKLGRLAVEAARLLRGKHAPDFVPYRAPKVRISIVNANKIDLPRKKLDAKKYWRHSGYLGGIKQISAHAVWDRDKDKVVRHAIAGMLPKNRLRAEMLRRLTICAGPSPDSKNRTSKANV